MDKDDLVSLKEFCVRYDIRNDFIDALNNAGLLVITSVEEEYYVDTIQLKRLEKMVRMHYDLDINVEGIEAITHLLDKIDSLQQDINDLKTRLKKYE